MSSVQSGGDVARSQGQLFLPAWWVLGFQQMTSFEISSSSKMSPRYKSPWSLAERYGVLPYLSVHEMAGLAVVIHSVQKQLLNAPKLGLKKQKKIVLNPYLHFREAGFASQSRLLGFERILQILPSVMIQKKTIEKAGQARGNGEGWIRLVEDFSWRIKDKDLACEKVESETSNLWELFEKHSKTGSRPQTQEKSERETWELQIELGAYGSELIFGLSDGYVDLIQEQVKEGKQQAGSFGLDPMTFPPLSVWRSLWLELTPRELAHYIKLEKAMQWEFTWIGLEGVFGVGLSEFFASSSRTQDGVDALYDQDKEEKVFARTMHCLRSLGKKLELHGYLTHLGQLKHQLTDLHGTDRDEEPMILWQTSKERILTDQLEDYKQAVRQTLSAPLMGYLKDRWLGFFRSDDSKANQFAKSLWEELSTQASEQVRSLMPLQGLEFTQASLWSPQVLFFEWVLRQRSSGVWPKLPEVIMSSPFASLINSQEKGLGTWSRRFEEFCLLLQDMPEITRMVSQEPLMSLASPVTTGLSELKAIYQNQLERSTEASRVSSAKTPETGSQEPLTDEKLSKGSAASKEARPALAVSMLRTAENELVQLESKNQKQYLELRRAYLGSLDDVGQKLIQDVQARMQPQLFEEHLRKRIIRFMVENPGVWSISKPNLAAKK